MPSADKQDKGIEQKPNDECGGAIHPTASEDRAETGGAERRAQHLLPHGLGRHVPDLLQACPGLFQCAFPGRDVITELTHFHDLLKLDGTDGNEFYVGIGRCLTARFLHFPGGTGREDSVGKDEEIARIHAIIGSDPGHDVLDAGDFRTVFQQNVSRRGSYFQNFG